MWVSYRSSRVELRMKENLRFDFGFVILPIMIVVIRLGTGIFLVGCCLWGRKKMKDGTRCCCLAFQGRVTAASQAALVTGANFQDPLQTSNPGNASNDIIV